MSRRKRSLGEIERILRLVALNTELGYRGNRSDSFDIRNNYLFRRDWRISYVKYPDCTLDVYSTMLGKRPIDDEGVNLRFFTALYWNSPKIYLVEVHAVGFNGTSLFTGKVYVKVYWSEIVEDDVKRGEKMVRLDNYYRSIYSMYDYNIITGYQLTKPRITARFIVDLEYDKRNNIVFLPEDERII